MADSCGRLACGSVPWWTFAYPFFIPQKSIKEHEKFGWWNSPGLHSNSLVWTSISRHLNSFISSDSLHLCNHDHHHSRVGWWLPNSQSQPVRCTRRIISFQSGFPKRFIRLRQTTLTLSRLAKTSTLTVTTKQPLMHQSGEWLLTHVLPSLPVFGTLQASLLMPRDLFLPRQPPVASDFLLILLQEIRLNGSKPRYVKFYSRWKYSKTCVTEKTGLTRM